MTTDKQRWIAQRTRPDEGAPSLSRAVYARTPNLALIAFLEWYGQNAEGTRIDIRQPGSNRHDIDASYVRGPHMWERQGC